jgi:hypothetical protein
MLFSYILKGRYWLIVFLLFLVVSGGLLLSSYAQKEQTINKILVTNNNQQKIIREDFRYRETIFNRYKNIRRLDSLSKHIRTSTADSLALIKIFNKGYLVEATESLSNYTFFVYGEDLSWKELSIFKYDSLPITIKFDKEKFISIIRNSQNGEEDRTLIMNGNFLANEPEFKIKLRTEFLMIILLFSILLPIFFNYYRAKKPATKFSKDTTPDAIDRMIQVVTNLSQENEAEQKQSAIQDLYKALKEKYSDDTKNSTHLVLKEDYAQFKDKATEIYERSALFLVFSFFISLTGIAVFIILLPEYRLNSKFVDYLGISLRPILILSFFQTLAYYLLKQYRGSMHDYKFFYLENRNRKRFLLAYNLLFKKNEEKAIQLIATEILKDIVVSTLEPQQEAINAESPSSNSTVKQIVELLKEERQS